MNHPDNHCRRHCDYTDYDDPIDDILRDKGCCTPMPVKHTCRAPIIPSAECDEEDPEVEFDPETQTYRVFSILYDQNCSPISDQNEDPIITQIG